MFKCSECGETDQWECVHALRQRLAELEQEEPERMCHECGLPVEHRAKMNCVTALQQENQRLRRERDKAVERFGMGVRSYRGKEGWE